MKVTSFNLLIRCLRPNHYYNWSSIRALSSAKNTAKDDYCLDLVRKHDYEIFLCTLLLPDARLRTSLFGVRALSTEISLVRDQISHKEIGLGRLTFWRDAINQLFIAKQSKNLKSVPRHPVAIALSRTVVENNVSKKWFVNLVDGREQVMTDTPFKSTSDLEQYCDQAFTPILYIGLEILGVKNVDVDHAASHLGKAIAISTFIRSLPFNAQRSRVLVPQELMVKHKVSEENFIRNNQKKKIQDIVHYEKAQSMKKSIDKKCMSLFLCGIPANI